MPPQSSDHRVSVIVPCYNAEQFIPRTLESVIQQTLPAWELIVVDDGSTDGSSGAVMSTFGDEPRIRLLHKPNGGVSSARNAGYHASSSDTDYLLFLDADDVLEPDMLEATVRYLDAHPDVGMVYCGLKQMDADGHALPTNSAKFRFVPSAFGAQVLPQHHADTPLCSVLTGWAGILPSTALIRRSVYEETPGFDEAFGQPYEDVDLFVHLAIRSSIHYLPRPLVWYRKHEGQSTRDRERDSHQRARFFEKWSMVPTELTPSQKESLIEARHFVTSRLEGVVGFRAVGRLVREGALGDASRFVLGAALRYTCSFLPARLSPYLKLRAG